MKRKIILTLSASLLLVVGCTNDFTQSSSSQSNSSNFSLTTSSADSSETSSSVSESSTSSNSSTSSISSRSNNYFEELNITKPIQSLGKGLCPSRGNVKALVVPINFSDVDLKLESNQLKKYFESDENNKSNPCSLKEFYAKSSYNKWNLSFTYLDAYTPSKPSTYYENKHNFNGDSYNTNSSRALYKEVLETYDSIINYSDYDSDNDGYIDAIYLVYNHSIDYTYSNLYWWAYTSWYENESDTFDNKKLGRFIWMSHDFFLKDDITNNTKTLIHETAHLCGIDDYYDYDQTVGATSGGLAGADLMDNDKGSPGGDHNPYSKALLGWTIPKVITYNDSKEEHIFKLKPFESSGDTLILSNNFSFEDELYQEYFTLEYYTPTGLNENDKVFSIPGIRVIHVSSKLTNKGKIKYDNTSTTYKLLSQITNSQGGTYINSSTKRDDSTLFIEGEKLEKCKYNSSEELIYDFEVISLTNEEATIKITKKI